LPCSRVSFRRIVYESPSSEPCLRNRLCNSVLTLFGNSMWEAGIWLPVLHICDSPGLWPVSSSLRMETRKRAYWLPVFFSFRLRTLCYPNCFKCCVCLCLKRNICWAPTVCQHSCYLTYPYLISKTSLWIVYTTNRNLGLRDR
jgi:hypothetical protein